MTRAAPAIDTGIRPGIPGVHQVMATFARTTDL